MTTPPPSPLNPENWPSVLAIPLRDYLQEETPFMKLWGLCDLAELILRLVTVIGVTELQTMSQNDSKMKTLRSELWERIQRPTVGQWKEMADKILKHLPQENSIKSDLETLLLSPPNGLFCLLDVPIGTTRSVTTSLADLRNKGLAHGAGVNKKQASGWLEIWQPRCEAALSHCEKILSQWHLVCIHNKELMALQGTKGPTPIELQGHVAARVRREIEAVELDAVVFVRGDTVRRLWPLTLFGSPRTDNSEDDLETDPSPQLYGRFDVALEYTPIGSEHFWRSVGSRFAQDEFVHLLKTQPMGQVRGFEQDLFKDAATLVGRKKELQCIYGLLAEREQGILWLTGRPGIGKSYLMARIATEPQPEQASVESHEHEAGQMRKLLVLPYRFKVGDDRCQRDQFCRFALERLREWSGLRPSDDPKGDSEETRQRKPLSLQLRETLDRVNRDEGWRVLLVLDGLDELLECEQPLHRNDPRAIAKFAQEVPLACGRIPGVIWLCAGRPEQALMQAFADETCTMVFPKEANGTDGGGVPPMDAADIRQMLLSELDGPARRRLLAKDRESADSQEVTNSFIAKVAANSQGVPLYVRFVLGEIMKRGGTLRHFDPSDLPKKLEDFYTRLIERSAVGVLQQITSPVVALLSVAHEPLDQDTLLTLLRDRNILIANPTHEEDQKQREHITQALAIVAPLLQSSSTPENTVGYSLTHHTLREFIRDPKRCESMHEPIRTAQQSLLNSCAKRTLLSGPARGYLIRQAVPHLIAGERWDDLYGLLTDIFFMEVKNEAGLLFDLVGDFTAALTAWPKETPQRVDQQRILRLLKEALRRDIHFIHRHREDYPQGLFQCLWNSGWWYDSLEARQHYSDSRPLVETSVGLHPLIERWREEKQQKGLTRWIRTLRPPATPIGSVAFWEGHSSSVTAIAVSRDALTAVSASRDRTIRLWDTKTSEELCCATLNERIDSLAFAASGDHVFGMGSEGRLYVWDVPLLIERSSVQAHDGAIQSMVLSSDGTWLFSGGIDGVVRVWNAKTLSLEKEVTVSTDNSPAAGVNSIASVSDGSTLLVMLETTLWHWKWRDGQLRQLARFTGVLAQAHIANAPNTDHVVIAVCDPDSDFESQARVSVFDIETVSNWNSCDEYDDDLYEQSIAYFYPGLDILGSWQFAFTPDGQQAALGGGEGHVTIWSQSHGEQYFRPISGKLDSISFCGSHLLLCGTHEGSIEVWKADFWKSNLGSIKRYHWVEAKCSLLSMSDDCLVISDGHKIELWNCMTGQLLDSVHRKDIDWSVHENWTIQIGALAISEDGRTIASGFSNGTVWIIDRENYKSTEQKVVYPFVPTTQESPSVLHGKAQVNLAADSTDHQVKLASWITSLAVSNSGGRIVLGTDNGEVAVLDAQSQTRWFVKGQKAVVTTLALSADASLVASAASDKWIRVWKVESGELLQQFEIGNETIEVLVFSPDGRFVSCRSESGLLMHFDLAQRNVASVSKEQGWSDICCPEGDSDEVPFQATIFPGELRIQSRGDEKMCGYLPLRASVVRLKSHPAGRTWAVIDDSLQFYVIE